MFEAIGRWSLMPAEGVLDNAHALCLELCEKCYECTATQKVSIEVYEICI